MTTKKTNPKTGEIANTIWGVLLGTQGFRAILIILVLSMHPIGRGFLAGFGFKFPDEKLITLAAAETQAFRTDIDALKGDVKQLKENSESARANNSIINSKLDRLEQSFSGFQIDFNKWKPTQKTEPQLQ